MTHTDYNFIYYSLAAVSFIWLRTIQPAIKQEDFWRWKHPVRALKAGIGTTKGILILWQ